jgi:cytochrome oxidase Cu insertion factor (SCO1/SenC/PrrC family)
MSRRLKSETLIRARELKAVWLAISLLASYGSSGCTRRAEMETRTNSKTLKSDHDSNSEATAAKGASKELRLPVLLNIPKFQLVDQAGEDFGSDKLLGHVWIANFMFTRCMATCPRQTAKFEELQRTTLHWPDVNRFRLISFTVDPEHDTPSHLNEYARDHRADPSLWKFLTGSRQDLWTLCQEGFKLPVSDSATDLSSPVTHSSKFVLVDKQLRIRGFYDGLSSDDFGKLVVDLRSLLSEPDGDNREMLHVGVPKDVFCPPWLKPRGAEQKSRAGDLRVFHEFAFADEVEASGIRFVNRSVTDATRNFRPNHYDHGNGIAVADVDGDGLIDVYFVNQIGGNELWRNLGRGRFEDMTSTAGVALKGRVCVAAAFADTDNDGDPDLYVTTTRHGNAFFQNDGQGHFLDRTHESGLTLVAHSSGADFFDFDRDGLLDLFVTNVGNFTTDNVDYGKNADNQEFPFYSGITDSFSGHLFPHRFEQSVLYHNEGGNRFRDVSQETGLIHRRWSGDATPLDFNSDGWIDLYVVNMQGNDDYYENVQGKRFECRSQAVFPRSVWGGMCAKSFDYNNDGFMDLFVTNMHADMWKRGDGGNLGIVETQKAPQDVLPESILKSRVVGMNIFGNAFYENRGGRFQEVSDQINVETFWPWGHSVADLNADGFQDLFVTAGMNYPFRYHHNSLLLNDHGERFHGAEFILGVEPRRDDQTAAPCFELDCAGADAGHALCRGCLGPVTVWGALGSRSSAIFDLDQDGDLDIVTNDFNGPPMILISNLSERIHKLSYLKVRLEGTRSNKSGLGAQVQLKANGEIFTQVSDGQSGYLSQSSLPLYFGLGEAMLVDQLVVLWPSGHRQVVQGPITVNRELLIIED